MIYSQRDPRWAHQRLGTADGVTIGGYGCYTTAQADVASDYGIDVNPAQLDDIFTANENDPYGKGGYVQGDLAWDGMLAKVYPDKFEFVGVYNCQNNPCDLNQLKPYDEYGKEAIIEVDFDHNPADGIQTHFVRMAFFNNGDPIIDDPWTGERIVFSSRYGSPAETIQKVVFYQAKLTPVANVPVTELPTATQRVLSAPAPVSEVAPVEAAPAQATTTPAPVLTDPTPTTEPTVIPAPVADTLAPVVEAPTSTELPAYSSDLELFEHPADVVAPSGSTVVNIESGTPLAQYPAGRKLTVVGVVDKNGTAYLQTENQARHNQHQGLPASDFELYVPKTKLDGITPPTPPAPRPAAPTLEEALSNTNNKLVRGLLRIFHHTNK